MNLITDNENMAQYPDRIPYEVWANSQLSVAKYYGRIKLGEDEYVLDFKNARREIVDWKERSFPDLVKVIKNPRKKKI